MVVEEGGDVSVVLEEGVDVSVVVVEMLVWWWRRV